MKYYILLLFSLLNFSIYCQKPNVINNTEIKPKHKNATKVSIKFGTTINFINKELYKKLNNGIGTYVANNASFYINPYASIGIEGQLSKKFGLQFCIGFYQTLQKYTTSNRIQFSYNSGTNLNNNYTNYQESSSEYLNNNVFFELLPSYKYKHTRFLAGFNITRTSPTVSARVTITDLRTGEVEVQLIRDKPEESYHVYSMLGIMQGFPIKKHELTISVTYFGFLKKYDSGLNLCLGFLF
jgi:hypothetical protein